MPKLTNPPKKKTASAKNASLEDFQRKLDAANKKAAEEKTAREAAEAKVIKLEKELKDAKAGGSSNELKDAQDKAAKLERELKAAQNENAKLNAELEAAKAAQQGGAQGVSAFVDTTWVEQLPQEQREAVKTARYEMAQKAIEVGKSKAIADVMATMPVAP